MCFFFIIFFNRYFLGCFFFSEEASLWSCHIQSKEWTSHFLVYCLISRWAKLFRSLLSKELLDHNLCLPFPQDMSHKMLSSGQCTAEDLCFSLQVQRTNRDLWSRPLLRWSACPLTRSSLHLNAGDRVLHAGGDHREGHGSLRFPGGPDCRGCWMWVNIPGRMQFPVPRQQHLFCFCR